MLQSVSMHTYPNYVFDDFRGDKSAELFHKQRPSTMIKPRSPNLDLKNRGTPNRDQKNRGTPNRGLQKTEVHQTGVHQRFPEKTEVHVPLVC